MAAKCAHPVTMREDRTGCSDASCYIQRVLVKWYSNSPARGYSRPQVTRETYVQLHKSLDGIDKVVVMQPDVYGVDNSCILNAVDWMKSRDIPAEPSTVNGITRLGAVR